MLFLDEQGSCFVCYLPDSEPLVYGLSACLPVSITAVLELHTLWVCLSQLLLSFTVLAMWLLQQVQAYDYY